MGLDISAYSHIKIVGFADEYDEDERVKQEYINEDFPHAVPADWDGSRFLRWQTTNKTRGTHFRAGSYSGYGLFRATLSEYSMGINTYDDKNDESMWQRIHDGVYDSHPFVELINFSDCEGVMFGPVCEKLYNDFFNHREAYEKWVKGNNPFSAWDTMGWITRYNDWMGAFDLARRDGVVSFH